MNTYAIWEMEYPDEGSQLYYAYSESGARRKWRKATRTKGPVSEQPPLGVCLMTPELLSERDRFYARQLEAP